MTLALEPFPFYYEELPTFQRAITSLRERDAIGPRPETYWFTICCRNNIFQLWNKEYIEALSKEILNLVGEDLVLEVAAGDGMLSHWLREHGVNIKATDNMSWHQQSEIYSNPAYKNRSRIKTHGEVEELDAISAIRKYKPRMVIASWLPYESELDCEILDEEPEYLILIGEGCGGCTGSTKFWGDWHWDEESKMLSHWSQKGYSEENLDVDTWNLCRTDYGDQFGRHGSTTLYTRSCQEGEE